MGTCQKSADDHMITRSRDYMINMITRCAQSHGGDTCKMKRDVQSPPTPPSSLQPITRHSAMPPTNILTPQPLPPLSLPIFPSPLSVSPHQGGSRPSHSHILSYPIPPYPNPSYLTTAKLLPNYCQTCPTHPISAAPQYDCIVGKVASVASPPACDILVLIAYHSHP